MHGVSCSRLSAGLALGAVLFVAGAGDAARQGSPRPDLSGFWVNQYTPNLSVALGSEPPFTEFGAERWRTVDTSKDPTGICLPVGPSRAFTAPFPFLLVQGADTIGILFEYQSIWRAIYMDGRSHPEDVADYPYFMGHSVGRWEGETLVIDTTGIDERSWLDTAGHEHSAQLRLSERLEKTGPDTIRWTVTYEDPVYFTRPWSITRTFTRGKPGDRLLPYTCNENNKDVEHLQTHQPNLNYKHVPEPAGTKPPPEHTASRDYADQPRTAESRYLVSERAINVGLGLPGLCVAVDPLDREGVWWWKPGRSGCQSRSTGPGVFAADRAIVEPSGRDGAIAVGFRVGTHSQREPYREVRLILEPGSIRMAGAELRIPIQRRVDLDLPEEPR